MTAPARNQVVVSAAPTFTPGPIRKRVTEILTSNEAASVIRPLIPKGVEEEQVLIEVFRAATVNPDILKCDQASIVMAVADCLRADLIIGKTIHLVPVSGKLQAWTDYKGDIELVVRSGAARHVEAHAVYEHDRFEVSLGTNPEIIHVPAPFNKERGKMIGAYAVAFISYTLKKVCVMRLDEIEEIRKKSRSWSPSKVAVCPEWYACKTTIHRVTKDLPKNPKLAQVLAMFERQDEIDVAETTDFEVLNEMRVDASTPGTPVSQQAPEPETAHEEAAAPAQSIEWALEYPFPFQRGTKLHGRPLNELSTDHLQSVKQWIVDKRAEKGDDEWNAEVYEAIRLVLELRANDPDQGKLFEEPPAPAGSGAEDMTLRPGNVEDALDKPEPKEESFGGLASTAAALLKDPKLDESDRKMLRAKFDAAGTVDEMKAVIAAITKRLDLPF